jgi:hypothetical protein
MSSLRKALCMRPAAVWLLAIFASTGFAEPLAAAEFFVAPDGKPTNVGTREAPWDWPTALSHPAAVKPGDVVWLRTGTYSGHVTCKLTGSPEKPIVVRQVRGERATVDCRSADGKPTIFAVDGADVRFQDFEITCSEPRRSTPQSGSWPTDLYRGGMQCKGDRVSLVNLVIHDCATGVGMWSAGESGECYGCLIYNNGWTGPDRGHGHGIYTQNERGTKRIVDNLIFNQFGYGIHAYGSSKATLEGYHIEGNVLFDNGILVGDGSRSSNVLVGGNNRAARIALVNNFVYHAGLEQTSLQIGYGPKSVDLELRNNYIAGFMRIMDWERAVAEGNTFVGKTSLIELHSSDLKGFRWNKNRYLSREERFAPFAVMLPQEKVIGAWTPWCDRTAFDADSKYEKGPPRGTEVFVRPNKYEPGRANIVVFNWDKASTVDVELKNGMKPGTAFRIVRATDFYGEPVVRGKYEGTPIKLPMRANPSPAPIGMAKPLAPTEPEFGAFVVLSE